MQPLDIYIYVHVLYLSPIRIHILDYTVATSSTSFRRALWLFWGNASFEVFESNTISPQLKNLGSALPRAICGDWWNPSCLPWGSWMGLYVWENTSDPL